MGIKFDYRIAEYWQAVSEYTEKRGDRNAPGGNPCEICRHLNKIFPLEMRLFRSAIKLNPKVGE